MKLLTGVLVSLLSLGALADDAPNGLICGEYAYVGNAEQPDHLVMQPVSNAFLLTGSGVIHGSRSYMAVNPKAVGLEEGVAKTYYDALHNKVLYIYQQDNGLVNIGVSSLVKSTDTGFKDKSVYTQCTYLFQPGLNNDIEIGYGKATKAVYRF